MANQLPPLAVLGDVERRISTVGITVLVAAYTDLVETQAEQLAAGSPTSDIPLLWRALAETAGLTVDNAGRIVDGPHAHVPGLGSVAVYPTCGGQTWTPQ